MHTAETAAEAGKATNPAVPAIRAFMNKLHSQVMSQHYPRVTPAQEVPTQ